MEPGAEKRDTLHKQHFRIFLRQRLSQRVKPRSQHTNIKPNKKQKKLRHYKSTFFLFPTTLLPHRSSPKHFRQKTVKARISIRWAPKPLNTVSPLHFSKILHFEQTSRQHISINDIKMKSVDLLGTHTCNCLRNVHIVGKVFILKFVASPL